MNRILLIAFFILQTHLIFGQTAENRPVLVALTREPQIAQAGLQTIDSELKVLADTLGADLLFVANSSTKIDTNQIAGRKFAGLVISRDFRFPYGSDLSPSVAAGLVVEIIHASISTADQPFLGILDNVGYVSELNSTEFIAQMSYILTDSRAGFGELLTQKGATWFAIFAPENTASLQSADFLHQVGAESRLNRSYLSAKIFKVGKNLRLASSVILMGVGYTPILPVYFVKLATKTFLTLGKATLNGFSSKTEKDAEELVYYSLLTPFKFGAYIENSYYGRLVKSIANRADMFFTGTSSITSLHVKQGQIIPVQPEFVKNDLVLKKLLGVPSCEGSF